MILLGKLCRLPPLMLLDAWRNIVRHPWQSGLNFIGVALGIMMVVAVDLANNSAKTAFNLSVKAINGNITHQISGGSAGVPEEFFTRIKTELGIKRSAPGISSKIEINGEDFTLLGIDPISELALQRQRPGISFNQFSIFGNLAAIFTSNNAVYLSESLANRLSLKQGEPFTAEISSSSVELVLAATYVTGTREPTQNILFADMAAAQTILRKTGVVDTIDLILTPTEAQRLVNWLPPSLALIETQSRNSSLRKMSNAFHINLLAMSLLSVLVAGLLVYNTVTLAVLQRHQPLGILRAQGASRKEILRLMILEVSTTGLTASATGAVAGYLLGRFLVNFVTQTIDNLYFDLTVTEFLLEPMVFVKGLLLGLITCWVSAALPIWNAVRVKPVTLQTRSDQFTRKQLKLRWLTVVGILSITLGYLLSSPEHGSLIVGFIALTFIVVGFCCLIPLAMQVLLQLLISLLGSQINITGKFTLLDIFSRIGRTGVAVAALSVAVSVTVGIGVMVTSFRSTVITWVDQTLSGEIQIAARNGSQVAFAEDFKQRLRSLSGVVQVSETLIKTIESDIGPVRLMASDQGAADRFYVKTSNSALTQAFDRGDGVFVSEPLAYLNNLTINDHITLITDAGPRSVPILGIFYDYTTDIGMVGMHSRLYRQWWTSAAESRLSLHVADPTKTNSVMENVDKLLSKSNTDYLVVDNRNIRRFILDIFDQTFAITNVLRILAIIVAVVAVLSTLLAMQLEKNREFAVLRATGMTPRQVRQLIVKQCAALGVLAGVFALPLGLAMSMVLIDVINRRSFGWSMQQVIPTGVLLEAFFLAVITALIAGIYPAMRAGKINPAVALRSE